MRSKILFAALVATASLAARPAPAHVVAGSRLFPVTLTFDDPGTNDEVSLPAIDYSRDGADGGTGPGHEVDLGFEYDKRITPFTALILNYGYDIQQRNGSKTQTGFENLVVTGKWQFYTNDAHEFVASAGLSREVTGIGTTHAGADRTGSTGGNLYVGKGLGDLPIGPARPFAVTGELTYTVADKGLKAIGAPAQPAMGGPDAGIATRFNDGGSNGWNGGLSLQYSLPYLQSQVRDIGLPAFAADLVPLVEFTWSSPASSPSGAGTTWVAAPGVIYIANWGEVGVEATIPLNRAAGTTVGAVGLVHVFLDDLFPDGIGKPFFD